jgi:hypothetical protein
MCLFDREMEEEGLNSGGRAVIGTWNGDDFLRRQSRLALGLDSREILSRW